MRNEMNINRTKNGLLLEEPDYGWTTFRMEGMDHEYILSCASDIPREWLDQCIHGLKKMRAFTVQGYLEPGRMICTVSRYNCCIYDEDELDTVIEPCTKSVTQIPVGMLEFSKMVCEAVENDYKAWVYWAATDMPEKREKMLRKKVNKLKELIEEKKMYLREPEIEIIDLEDLEANTAEPDKRRNNEEHLILSKPEHGWSIFRPEKDGFGCSLSYMTNVPMDWVDKAIEGLITGEPFCVVGELEPGMMIFVVAPASSYQIVETGFSEEDGLVDEFCNMGMLSFCKELYKALMTNIEEWESWGAFLHENGKPGNKTLREKLDRLQGLIQGIERKKQEKERCQAAWEEEKRSYEEEIKSRPKPEVTDEYRKARTEELKAEGRIKEGKVIVPLLEGEMAPLERYLSIEQMTLDDLVLTVRAHQCLKRADKTTLKEIMVMTKKELFKVRNLGKKCVDEIMAIANELLFESE